MIINKLMNTNTSKVKKLKTKSLQTFWIHLKKKLMQNSIA